MAPVLGRNIALHRLYAPILALILFPILRVVVGWHLTLNFISNNKKDFSESDIFVLTVDEFQALYLDAIKKEI